MYIQPITKGTEYQRKYLAKNPWLKNLAYSRIRSRRNGRENTLTPEIIKKLWFRDNAATLDSPSIDRKDSSKGYIESNCRFIERSENCRLGMMEVQVKKAEKRKKTGSKCLRCVYVTNSKYKLCGKHYRQQMARIRQGTITRLDDIKLRK